MSGAAFDGVAGHIRHWRSRLPQTADLRDTFDYYLLDRFYYVSKPGFVIDPATGETNAERTYSCVCPTASGARDGEFNFYGGCRRNDDTSGLPIPFDQRYTTNSFCSPPLTFPPASCTPRPPQFDLPAMPSGYTIRSYPILRLDAEGERLVAQFDERVVVETRYLQNVPVTTLASFDTCRYPDVVTQETYTFLGAGPSQQLVGSVVFNDSIAGTRDFSDNADISPVRRRYNGTDYVLPLDVEEATGFWHRATDVWVKHINRDGTEAGGSSPPILPDDDVRVVSVYTARASRRSMPGLVR
jgi:hypothetical protein